MEFSFTVSTHLNAEIEILIFHHHNQFRPKIMAYRLNPIGIISSLFAIPLLMVSIYRISIESKTYFWNCYPARINSIKTIETKRGKEIAVTYTIDNLPKTQFNRVTPIANDEYRSDDQLTFPVSYASRINHDKDLKACTAENGKTAVLFPGISIETIYYLCALTALTLCINFDCKRNRLNKSNT